MAHDVFISHAKQDKAIADAVCATLEQQGIRCWIAPRDIQPGMDWGHSLITGLKGSRVLVLILSRAANASPHILREVERAVHLGAVVIPVRIEDVMPEGALEYHLGTVHWLDAMTPPLEAHLKHLATTLKTILAVPASGQRAEPPEPESSQPPHGSEPNPGPVRADPQVTTAPRIPAAPARRRPGIPLAVGLIVLTTAGVVWRANSDRSPSRPAPPSSPAFLQARAAFFENRVADAFPLFAAASGEAPGNPDLHAWYGEAARRIDSVDLAIREGRTALSLDPCHAFAHLVIADSYNPQRNPGPGANEDSTWSHLRSAVQCDSTDGNVWLGLWIEAIHHQDLTLEHRALTALADLHFIPEPWLSHGRWVLAMLPARAIALANGDMDTYPPLVVQATTGERPDVAVVNVPMLELPWYVEHLRHRYQLPIPASLQASADQTTSEAILAYWRRQAAAGQLDRPLAFLMTMGSEAVARGPGYPSIAGPFWRIDDVALNADAIDHAAVDFAYRVADTLPWAGPRVAPEDRSPVRHASTIHPALMVAYLWAVDNASRSRSDAFQAHQRAWIDGFLQRVGVPLEDARGILGGAP